MSQKAKYDPLLFKLPKGTIVKGQEVKFFIEYYDEFLPRDVYFMIKQDGENEYKYISMIKTQKGYEISQKFTKSGQYWYNFQFAIP